MSVVSRLKDLARRGRSRVEPILYAGDNVACNLCGARARSWLRGRVNGRCPTCRAPTRTRTLWWYLQNRVPDLRTLRVLHFAPEKLLEARLRASRVARYETCDLRGGHVDHQADIQALPFPDASYDLVLCSHVLEHVPDDRAAMRELGRICRPGGRVLIMVPCTPTRPTDEYLGPMSPEARKARFGEVDHLREYGSDLVERLAATNLTITVFEPAKEIPANDRARHGLGPEQLIYTGTR